MFHFLLFHLLYYLGTRTNSNLRVPELVTDLVSSTSLWTYHLTGLATDDVSDVHKRR